MGRTPKGPQPNWHSFAPITTYDHAGYLWTTALYCIIFSTLVFATRAYIKKNSWGRDDSVFAAAFVAQVGHVVAIFAALKHGLGRVPGSPFHPPGERTTAKLIEYAAGGKAVFAALIFLVISLALAKISVVLFIRRLVTRNSHMLIKGSYLLHCVCALWGLASLITISVDCSPSWYITDYSARRCGAQGRRWVGIVAIDALTEIMITAYPVVLVWPLKMSAKLKVQVTSAFVFRLGVAAAAIMHAVWVFRHAKSVHPSLAMVPTIIIAEAELCWSLVSATIPNLKNFMRRFSTGFGHEFGLGTTTTSEQKTSEPRSVHESTADLTGLNHVSNVNKSNADYIGLNRLSKSSIRNAGPTNFVTTNEYDCEVSRGDSTDDRSATSGRRSDEMIIKRDVTMTVDYSQP
ncbi:hypothetical protein LTR37_003489 [Vermiconidia calcicola]|uniref:Uncharacterized protein n=1 Tax=Vermiconidia calcicola TaxID=1690605 RepID=A0ACC3NPJ5_9PEZI|nr:hypothetical protein LTR37_003489 [Vermiconidia calcicola]